MSWIRNIFFILISILIGILIMELFVRFIFIKSDKKVSINDVYGLSEKRKDYIHTCDHGWCAKPGIYKNVIKSVNETKEIIYAVKYTIGQNYLRNTPKLNSNSNILMRYFGGSFVFGEGLSDIETIAYYSQLASEQIKAENLGFHGHGVHNALRLLQSKEISKESINLLLTGTFHAFRSSCLASYFKTHPRYELQNGKVVYKGKCSAKKDEGWIRKTKKILDTANIFLNARSLQILSDFLQSSFTLYQIELYQNLIREFYHLSLERGENPIILYIKDHKRSYLTAGFITDPMYEYFQREGMKFMDITLPDEDKFYLHKLDRHPSAFANCTRVKIITKKLGITSKRLSCNN